MLHWAKASNTNGVSPWGTAGRQAGKITVSDATLAATSDKIIFVSMLLWSDSLTTKKRPCSLCYWKQPKSKLPKMCKRKLVDTVIFHNSHRHLAADGYATCRIWIVSPFFLFYVLQSEVMAANTDIKMKAQMHILEEQRQEVSTFQNWDLYSCQNTCMYLYS